MTERVLRKCPMCGTYAYLDVDSEALDKYEAGALIQDAFPNENVFDREFIKTGYCKECQMMLFGVSPAKAAASKIVSM